MALVMAVEMEGELTGEFPRGTLARARRGTGHRGCSRREGDRAGREVSGVSYRVDREAQRRSNTERKDKN